MSGLHFKLSVKIGRIFLRNHCDRRTRLKICARNAEIHTLFQSASADRTEPVAKDRLDAVLFTAFAVDLFGQDRNAVQFRPQFRGFLS